MAGEPVRGGCAAGISGGVAYADGMGDAKDGDGEWTLMFAGTDAEAEGVTLPRAVYSYGAFGESGEPNPLGC